MKNPILWISFFAGLIGALLAGAYASADEPSKTSFGGFFGGVGIQNGSGDQTYRIHSAAVSLRVAPWDWGTGIGQGKGGPTVSFAALGLNYRTDGNFAVSLSPVIITSGRGYSFGFDIYPGLEPKDSGFGRFGIFIGVSL